MSLTQEFSESLEHELFLPISRRGLDNFAQESYEGFIKQLNLDNAHTIRNAFLLHFANALTEFNNPSINPEDLKNSMEKTTLRTAKMLHNYAEGFLQTHGQNGEISQSLYAAGIAAAAIKDTQPNNKYIGLIGSEAFKFVFQSNRIGDEPTLFKKESIAPESKTLHLALLIRRMNAAITITDHNTKKIQPLSPTTHAAILEILEHADDLVINPKNSSLESLVQRKYDILQDTLDNTPIYDLTNVVDISHKATHNDR